MNPKDIALLELLTKFSHAIEVTPPTTKDIGHWWRNTLEEISDHWLLDIKEYGLFSKERSPLTKTMHIMLLNQIEKRKLVLVNTLA
ncbi:hypothetical protein [Lysinibacillus sp. 54212]|uniref:hypothetical protein n=1 Tax=Lysinibacillus sp. 54212 TaxID=3119829 RepID=UPI002FC7E963